VHISLDAMTYNAYRGRWDDLAQRHRQGPGVRVSAMECIDLTPGCLLAGTERGKDAAGSTHPVCVPYGRADLAEVSRPAARRAPRGPSEAERERGAEPAAPLGGAALI
jgi:hypothetical protein